jgi:hypothetical protein
MELKRAKTRLGTIFFNHPEDDRRRLPLPQNYTPRGKTGIAAYIHKTLAKI